MPNRTDRGVRCRSRVPISVLSCCGTFVRSIRRRTALEWVQHMQRHVSAIINQAELLAIDMCHAQEWPTPSERSSGFAGRRGEGYDAAGPVGGRRGY